VRLQLAQSKDTADDISGLFEIEVTRSFARHRLEGCRIPADRPSKMYYDVEELEDQDRAKTAPRVQFRFIVRLLEEHFGQKDRTHATVIHRAVDELMKQSKNLGLTLERGKVLRNSCETVHLCGISAEIFWRRQHYHNHQPASEREWTNEQKQQQRMDVLHTAYTVAIVMRYTDIEEAMLASGEILALWDRTCLGAPLARAIEFGHCDSVRRWVRRKPPMSNEYRSYDSPFAHGTIRKALRAAAGNGDEEIIRLILELNSDDDALWSQIVTNTVQFQQPELFRTLMKQHSNRIYHQKRHEVLTWAARHGNNDMINLMMADDNSPWKKDYLEDMVGPVHTPTESSPPYPDKGWEFLLLMVGPLCEAVRHGHLETVKLILDYKPPIYDMGSHIMKLAQNVAIGGNFDLFQLLREQPFWRPHLEWVILPIAAHFGHLDFLRYAVEHRKIPQRDPFKLGDADAIFDCMFRVSVLLAVAAGHVSIVRWFATELNVDMGIIELDDDEDGPTLFPLLLAVDSGNTTMVKLLTQELGVELLGDGYWPSMCEEGQRSERRYVLDRWVRKLKVVKLLEYPYLPERKAFRAFLLAKGLWNSFEVYFGSLEGYVSDHFRASHEGKT
jgi:hypothetical protein